MLLKYFRAVHVKIYTHLLGGVVIQIKSETFKFKINIQ